MRVEVTASFLTQTETTAATCATPSPAATHSTVVRREVYAFAGCPRK